MLVRVAVVGSADVHALQVQHGGATRVQELLQQALQAAHLQEGLLVYDGKKLLDTQATLAQENINDGATLHLIPQQQQQQEQPQQQQQHTETQKPSSRLEEIKAQLPAVLPGTSFS